MSKIAKVVYQGNLRTELTHLKSNAKILTDAPTDNHGKGESFSPTDMLASSLASCIITVMAIKANDLQINLIGTFALVEKVMKSNPRAVKSIKIELTIISDCKLPSKHQQILENTAKTCPVAYSLHPDIHQELVFNYQISN